MDMNENNEQDNLESLATPVTEMGGHTQEYNEGEDDEGVSSLGMVLDVPLNVSVELGRTDISLKELLQFKEGTVLELDKLAGEPLEVLVNKRDVAKGEVVVINEKFGIRLTDIIGGKIED